MKAAWLTLVPALLLAMHVQAAGAVDWTPGGTRASQKSRFVITPALQTILDATDGSERPVLSKAEREAFDAMSDQAKKLTADAVAEEMITSAGHLKAILSLGLSNGKYELFMRDNCILCHSDPEFHEADTLLSTEPSAVGSPAHMNLADMVNDVHFRPNLSCAGCHDGDPEGFMEHGSPEGWPEDADARRKDRTWIPQFCSRCHSDTGYMRRFNPGLPVDQFTKYATSSHGKLLLERGDSRAAQCVSCHGRHGIQSAKVPSSKVYPKSIAKTCGACHANPEHMAGFTLADGSPMPTNQLETYESSVHGRALLERGDTGAATCNDCHGNHAAVPPEVASVAQICRICHAGNGALFDGSNHKKAFEANGWPECGACHGNHDISKASDTMLGTGEGSVCAGCHEVHAKDNPECNAVADYFHDTIFDLSEALEAYDLTAEELAQRGLDDEALRQELDKLSDTLRQSRSYIHAFAFGTFQRVTKPGKEAIHRMDELVEEAEEEFRARRAWLLTLIAFTGILAVILFLEIRGLERRR